MRRMARLVLIVGLLLAGSLGAQTASDNLSALLTEALGLMTKGDYDRAEKRLQTSDEPQALRLRMELADRRGDRAAAEELARRLYRLYQTGALTQAVDFAQAAMGAWRLEQWHEANAIFREGSKIAGAPPSLFVDWGHLHLQRFTPNIAQDIFNDAIKAGVEASPPARWGPEAPYLGLARSLNGQNLPGADKVLEKAIEMNPDNLDLISQQIEDALQDSNRDEAQRLLKKGLELNPNHLRLLELKAAYHYFQFQQKEFEKARDRVLEINPVDADLFETLADLCTSKRRLEEAIDFDRRAIQLNPRQWSAMASLGINLLRVGEETEGKETLELAYANDSFNLWTVNTLRLLDSFENFTRFETPHFRAKIQTKEVGPLRPYVSDLLEKSLTSLAAKYQFPLSGKYVFEMYANHDDFAVRTLGLPGLGALGATFGRVVAMDSPSARPGGKFHWGSTLWHEVAHIVTLGLSNQKVPRWFTEGLSMMEERHSIEGWGDFLGIGFVKAYEKGQLLSLAELDEGFQRPKFAGQIELSYFQAGWLCDYLAAHYGSGKIREMLLAFGQDKAMEEVFKEVLGVSVEEVDRGFKAEMDATLKPLVKKLKQPELFQAGAERDMAAIELAYGNDPDNYFLNLAMARRLVEGGRASDAVPYVEKAIEIFPTETGEDSPYALLSKIAEQDKDEDLRLKALRMWWEASPRFASSGIELAALLKGRGEFKEAARVLEGVMYVDPLRPEAHQELGELYLKLGAPEKALAELRILIDMTPPDMARARYGLAEALAAVGRPEEARKQVLFALEIAPGYADAQKLLLKLVRQ